MPPILEIILTKSRMDIRIQFTHMPTAVEKQLKDAIDKILGSKSPRKLIVAGPGAGKTTLFKLLLEAAPGGEKSRLVLTFINNLKDDLAHELAGLATVLTLHGYCQSLLHRPVNVSLRDGLTSSFRCLPGLASLIKKDWKYLRGEPVPHLVNLMRELENKEEELDFYKARANYYDAVDFDDSIYRTYQGLKAHPGKIEEYDLVLIDEYQDFNRVEAGLIDLLAQRSPIVVAGDDDQALYSQLKGASWEFIRSLHGGGKYEVFKLPFCMRCPEVIVDAVNDIITVARESERLQGRIEKPFLHYEPVKGADSEKYPNIDLIVTTVQREKANYFGRYIERAINNLPKDEIKQAAAKGEPAVLVIGSKPYLPQVAKYLVSKGFVIEVKQDSSTKLEESQGFEILSDDPESNLGWRVMLEFETIEYAMARIKEAAEKKTRLVEILPREMKERVLADAKAWAEEQKEAAKEVKNPKEPEGEQIRIKLTSFEGAKGLSAQHVFILGMHEGEMPRDVKNIQDLEICRLVVGLTRTKKKCSILLTRNFASKWKNPSVFLRWIKKERFQKIEIDAGYWKPLQEIRELNLYLPLI